MQLRLQADPEVGQRLPTIPAPTPHLAPRPKRVACHSQSGCHSTEFQNPPGRKEVAPQFTKKKRLSLIFKA